MEDAITRMLTKGGRSQDQPFGKMFGVSIGLVTNNKDPDKMARIKVKFPWLAEEAESFWCRLASPWAGKDRGQMWIPEVEDEVLVAFEHGDLRFPYIIGSLWNGKDTPPAENETNVGATSNKLPNEDGENNHKYWRTREGHQLHFDDTKGGGGIMLRTNKGHEICCWDEGGEERIRFWDKDKDNYVDISTTDKKITVETKTGDILIKAKKTITMECKDFVLKADKTCKSEAGTTWDQKSGTAMKVNSGTSMKTESGSTMDIKAGATMTQKAPQIKIN